jgi:hypothetical protein
VESEMKNEQSMVYEPIVPAVYKQTRESPESDPQIIAE